MSGLDSKNSKHEAEVDKYFSGVKPSNQPQTPHSERKEEEEPNNVLSKLMIAVTSEADHNNSDDSAGVAFQH